MAAPVPRPPLIVEPLGGDPPRYRVVDPAGSGEPHIVTIYPAGPICDCKDFLEFGKRRGVACKHTDAVLEYQREKTSATPVGPGLERDVPLPEPPARTNQPKEVVGSIGPAASAAAIAAAEALLSGILLAKTVPATVAAIVDSRMFPREAQRLVYDAAVALTARGEPVDPITLKAAMDGQLEHAGGMEFIAHLIDVVPTPDHIDAHARIVRHLAREREFTAIAQQLGTEKDPAARRALLARAQTAADELGNIAPSRFRLLTIAELRALAPPAWLLADYLAVNALSVLYGLPGSAKTFLALAWALCIAMGLEWIDRAVKRGNVVYVAAEGGSGLGQRITAFADSHELAAPDGIHFIHEPVNLLEARDVDALIAATTALSPVLYVVDTLSRCMAGGDENSAQDVGRVIASTDRIRRATGAAVLIVHHTGKDGLAERGSSALRGAADVMFALENDDGVLTLKGSKQHKDAPPVADRQLRLVAVGSSCLVEPEDSVSTFGRLERMDRLALEALNAIALEDGATYSQWRDAAMDDKHGKVSMSRATFSRSRKRLVDAGLVQTSAKGKRYLLSGKGISACAVS